VAKVATSGRDPIKDRERIRREAAAVKPTLEAIASEPSRHGRRSSRGDGKAGRWVSPLELHVLPKLGKTPIEDIDQNDGPG
jgi:hypothetical protein